MCYFGPCAKNKSGLEQLVSFLQCFALVKIKHLKSDKDRTLHQQNLVSVSSHRLTESHICFIYCLAARSASENEFSTAAL